MNNRAIEIQIYFEIAMAIGNSLDLDSMLQQALSAYLRKLSCATGMVLQAHEQDNRYHFRPCFSIPRNSLDNPVYKTILQQLPKNLSQREFNSFYSSLPTSGTVNKDFHFHFCDLPRFGLLLLIRRKFPIETRTLHSLRQLNTKLAGSCNACLQKERIEVMNDQLNHEIEQRLIAEGTLKNLLDNLENTVQERTKALEKSRKRYKVLFDNIQDIYFSLNLHGVITEISPSVESTLQYQRMDLVGHSIEFIGLSTRERLRFMQRLEQEGKIRDYPLSIPARDGEQHYFSMNAVLSETDRKGTLQIVGSLRDITEQHHIEESRQLLEEQLLNSRKMEALGLLAGGVAHDLNNVLSGIVSYPDLLLSQLEEDSPLRRPIGTIRDSGEKAAAIVQDLLTIARRNVVQKHIINLNALIQEYLDSPEFHKLVQSHRQLLLTPQLSDDLLNMQGSPLHLKKALMNLVHNGAEAGADSMQLVTENVYVEADQAAEHNLLEGDYICLDVIDNGHGISAQDQKRIFEPFYTKKVMGRSGTGLGMSVVWGTVEDHNGYITIDSRPDEKKTVIQLLLPASRQKVTSRSETRKAELYHAKGETILVVDDMADQREIAKAILMSMGYKVQVAGSGEQAVAMLRTAPVDLILLDMIMGNGMDGLDTFREICRQLPHCKVIIATGYSETERVKKALHEGVLMYIRKPYLLRTIGKALRQCLDNTVPRPPATR